MTEPPSRHHLHGARALGWAVVSISDTRTASDDRSGVLAKSLLEGGGHRVVRYGLVANETDQIRVTLGEWLKDPAVEAALTLGGTGVGTRDRSVSTLDSMGGQLVPGFGELFRSISRDEVGPLAMLSRAGLYLVDRRPVFALPGSERGVRTALERLILPAVQHLVEELER